MDFWRSASTARSYGCTHRARMYGVLPGFFNPENNLWVSRSDLLNPIEDLINWGFGVFLFLSNQDHPGFPFSIREEIN